MINIIPVYVLTILAQYGRGTYGEGIYGDAASPDEPSSILPDLPGLLPSTGTEWLIFTLVIAMLAGVGTYLYKKKKLVKAA